MGVANYSSRMQLIIATCALITTPVADAFVVGAGEVTASGTCRPQRMCHKSSLSLTAPSSRRRGQRVVPGVTRVACSSRPDAGRNTETPSAENPDVNLDLETPRDINELEVCFACVMRSVCIFPQMMERSTPLPPMSFRYHSCREVRRARNCSVPGCEGFKTRHFFPVNTISQGRGTRITEKKQG